MHEYGYEKNEFGAPNVSKKDTLSDNAQEKTEGTNASTVEQTDTSRSTARRKMTSKGNFFLRTDSKAPFGETKINTCLGETGSAAAFDGDYDDNPPTGVANGGGIKTADQQVVKGETGESEVDGGPNEAISTNTQ